MLSLAHGLWRTPGNLPPRALTVAATELCSRLDVFCWVYGFLWFLVPVVVLPSYHLVA